MDFTAPIPNEKKPNKKVIIFILLGCASLLLFSIFFSVFLYFLFSPEPDHMPSLEKDAKTYLQLLDEAQYAKAYEKFLNPFRQKDYPLQGYSGFESKIRKVLGTCKRIELKRVKTVDLRSVGLSYKETLIYLAEFERDTFELEITFEKVGPEWKVNGIYYNSPVLKEAFRCSNCGKINYVGSTKCRHCFEKINLPGDTIEIEKGEKYEKTEFEGTT